MDRSRLIKIALLVCSGCFLIAAISLFAEGDIASGVCGLALAVVLKSAKLHTANSTVQPHKLLLQEHIKSTLKRAANVITATKNVPE